MEGTRTQDQATEDRIFDAANAVFLEAGFDGARMKEIARRAGINHSMLHYYFRTKGQLFDDVFRRTAKEFMPPILETLRADDDLLSKTDAFIVRYHETLRRNPHMPAFMMQELRRNPQALGELAGSMLGEVVGILQVDIAKAVAAGRIRPISAEDLIANLLGLCVYPFLARPMLEAVFEAETPAYDQFLDNRPETVQRFMRHALAP
ncbi:MAG: TetR family transcriptional regulator [Rhodothermales bacterium]|nr:TetR family transcriptional regulator [Rhodothermales bacterium]